MNTHGLMYVSSTMYGHLCSMFSHVLLICACRVIGECEHADVFVFTDVCAQMSVCARCVAMHVMCAVTCSFVLMYLGLCVDPTAVSARVCQMCSCARCACTQVCVCYTNTHACRYMRETVQTPTHVDMCAYTRMCRCEMCTCSCAAQLWACRSRCR